MSWWLSPSSGWLDLLSTTSEESPIRWPYSCHVKSLEFPDKVDIFGKWENVGDWWMENIYEIIKTRLLYLQIYTDMNFSKSNAGYGQLTN